MSEGIRRGRPSMRGSSQPRTLPGPSASQTPARIRVLFVCVGNSCRSQMAEGFARKYGQGLIEPLSAGLMPAAIVQEDTHRIMAERGVALDGQYPKGIEMFTRESLDVVVNISGFALPAMNARQIFEWQVRDPIGESEGVYRMVAGQIEQLVMRLVAELRARR